MSCLGPNYHPIPPREWSRFENPCAYSNVDVPKNVAGAYQLEVFKKGNILQYKKNSACITKKQRYSQIARGAWVNRTTTWATQTQSYTNPNTNSLRRSNYTNIDTSTLAVTSLPLSCTVPMPPLHYTLPIIINSDNSGIKPPPIIPSPVPPSGSSSNQLLPPITPTIEPPPIVIPDGGVLICNVSENICTGEIYSETISQFCYPTTDSDVPGPVIFLCYNDGLPTYYPRTRRVYSAGGNKWPQGEKLLFSANSIVPTNAIPEQLIQIV